MTRTLSFCLALGVSPLAGQSGVEVRSSAAKLLDTAPGRIVTMSIVAVNHGSQDEEFTERVTLPPGCQKVAPPDLPFQLSAGGQMIRLLAVSIPSNMAAGRFKLSYMAQGRHDPASSDSIDLAIQVAPVDNLGLIVDPQSGPVFSGDAYPIKLRVTNGGNSPVIATLVYRSSLGFPVSADVSVCSLNAGVTREIHCRVQTDKTFASHTSHAVTFDVTATTSAGKTLTASQASVVEVIPLVSGKRDPFHKLLVQHRIIGIAETGQDAQMQTEFSGEGSLDEAGEHRVDFIFRSMGAQNSSVFGQREQYGAGYHGKHWDLDLGDRVYSLSPLTEKRAFGRGAGIAWHNDNTAAGMFYLSTRLRQENSSEFGTYLRQNINQQLSFQGNFLRKTFGDSASVFVAPQNTFSLESHYRLEKFLDLKLEAGVSRSDDGGMDYGYRAEANGELAGHFSYALNHTHAGPDFHGYYNNTDNTYVSINKVVNKDLRLHASLNRYAGNIAVNDVLSSVVNQENSWNTGANYALADDTDISLDWQHVARADVLLPAAYDFTEDSIRFGAAHRFRKFQFQGSLDVGTLDNSITGTAGEFARYRGVFSWCPTAAQSYSVFATRGPSAFSGSSDSSISAGASARLRLSEKLTANVSYARNQFEGLSGLEMDQVFASVQYQFANKNSIALTARWMSGGAAGNASAAPSQNAVMVTFTIPFGLPVSRKRSIGTLEGRLVDVTNHRMAGLPRVVVQAGTQFAVTDAMGRFEFPALKPGACEVTVMPDSLGSRMAMVTPLPLKVTVRPAKTTQLELTATAAASLSVTVMRYEFANGNSVTTSGELKEAGGEEAAIVEISNGRDTWRAQTDRLGCASFDRLPGGSWRFRVASSDPSPFRTIDKPDRTLTLKPGESQQIAVRVLPQRRTIKILDRGTIQ